ncbi:aldo/keto reductase [Pelagimonas varians]|uniref:Pyridoxal 4-dehydrogenase n=1 Tax=Pelagimonas varians TaxID=696760 RepID=A0A238JSM2_9RHOB|nr:aldo/keto reductase [Pelagimonas varians]PYG34534.1 D-threo-aldose 1-dehydrogenase [Pelagimonas varians]SMX33659.1 Pyridoxal 4-dehydrogenase [Pelagimonas varians]
MKLTKRQIGQTGLMVPTLGFGGAPLGGLLGAVDADEAALTLRSGFDSGMRYVDTAPFYGFGRSERLIGDGLRGRDYILSTKVGRLLVPGAAEDPAAMGWPDALPFHPVYDYSYDGIMRSVADSLQRLGLDRIDILYVHDIGELTHGVQNAGHFRDLAKGGYRALDELRVSGVVKAIGLGVNEEQACLDALDIGDWDVFLLAGRYTLLEQGSLTGLMQICADRNVSIVLGGPFNSGILVGGRTWNYSEAPQEVIDKVAALSACCAEYDVPLPAAALHFPLAHAAVASVIPGLRSRKELAATQEWIRTDIPPALWADMKAKGVLDPQAPVPGENLYRAG